MTHLGPYELRGELGRGAMAVVWRAWDSKLDREVALKEPLLSGSAGGAVATELGKRFVNEARAAGRLNHPNIVTVYNADVYDDRPAMVMELIEGQTLSDIVCAGPVQPAFALSVLDQLLQAVGYAHSRGVIHRDIKPDNVFVTRDGHVKLADFGVAHLISEVPMTQEGTVLGTPGYMAPEQVVGSPVDERADLFAIGAIGYEMLAGTNPFGGHGDNSTAVMYRIVHERPIDLASVLPSLPAASVIMQALEKDPAARPGSADAMRARLGGAPLQARTDPVTVASVPPASSTGSAASWLPFAVAAALVLITLATWLAVSAGGPHTATNTSSAPVVSITSPANASAVVVGQSISVAVDAAHVSGVRSVKVYVGNDVVKEFTSGPYTAEVALPVAGDFMLKAVAVANDGRTAESPSIVVTAKAASPAPSAAPVKPAPSAPAPARPSGTPDDAVAAYWNACNSGDFDGAWTSFSSAYQRRTGVSKYRENFQDLKSASAQLRVSEDGATYATVYCRVETDSYSAGWETWAGDISLVAEGGAWRIDRMGLRKQ